MKKLALCFSGSLRSIEHCYQSINDNILNVNKNNFDITIFFHIPEDGNDKKIYQIQEIMQLEPVIKVEKDEELKIPNCIYNGRNMGIDNKSIGGLKGWIYQLQGIEKSYNMMLEYEKQKNISFDYIARLRSDVLYLQPFIFEKSEEDILCLPFFHIWYGVNDRFAFGNKKVMDIYMKMYSYLYTCCEKEKLNIRNAEWFCKYNLITNNIKYIENPNILFNRIRINGEISIDCKINGNYSKPHMVLIK